jgi:hypothetical protein
MAVQDKDPDWSPEDITAIADALEGIRQGLEDMRTGNTRPVHEVFDAIRAEYEIPR